MKFRLQLDSTLKGNWIIEWINNLLLQNGTIPNYS
jgi:hypothetical protein